MLLSDLWWVGWCLMALSAQTGCIVPSPPKKLILYHTNSSQMAEPGFKLPLSNQVL